MVTECEGNQVFGSKLQAEVAKSVRRLDLPDEVHGDEPTPLTLP